jgi:Ca2+/Na+ antiporter
MKPQERRQRIQRNQIIAQNVAMILAGMGIGTYFVMQAIEHAEKLRFNIYAAIGSYAVALFFVWRQVRRWRREKRIKQILAEKEKGKQGGSG